jgi:hypothetical protein
MSSRTPGGGDLTDTELPVTEELVKALFEKKKLKTCCPSCNHKPNAGKQAIRQDGHVTSGGRKYPRFKCTKCGKTFGHQAMFQILTGTYSVPSKNMTSFPKSILKSAPSISATDTASSSIVQDSDDEMNTEEDTGEVIQNSNVSQINSRTTTTPTDETALTLQLLMKQELQNQTNKIFAFLKSQDQRLHEVETRLDSIVSDVKALGNTNGESQGHSSKKLDSIVHDLNLRLAKLEKSKETQMHHVNPRPHGKGPLTTLPNNQPKASYSEIIRQSPSHLQDGIKSLIQGTRRFTNQSKPTTPRNETESSSKKRLFYVSGWVRAPIREIKERLKKAYFSLRLITNIRWVGLTTLEFMVDETYSSKFSFQIKKLNGYLTLVEDYNLEQSPNMEDTPEAKSQALERFVKGICLQMLSTTKLEVVNFYLKELYDKDEVYAKKAVSIITSLRDANNSEKAEFLMKIISAKSLVPDEKKQATRMTTSAAGDQEPTSHRKTDNNPQIIIDTNRDTVRVVQDILEASQCPASSKLAMDETLSKIHSLVLSANREETAFEELLYEAIEIEDFKDQCLKVLDIQDGMMVDTTVDFAKQENSLKNTVSEFQRKIDEHVILLKILDEALQRHDGHPWSPEISIQKIPSAFRQPSEETVKKICEYLASNLDLLVEEHTKANLFLRKIVNELDTLINLGNATFTNLCQEIDVLDNLPNTQDEQLLEDEVEPDMDVSNE